MFLKKKLERYALGWVVGGSMLLFGIYLLGLAVNMVNLHLQALSWQPVSATLLKNYVKDDSDETLPPQRLDYKFVYVWGGHTYESTRLSFAKGYYSRRGSPLDDWGKRVGTKIGEVGEQFTAHVNPYNPSQAVALADIRWVEIAINLIVGLIAIAFGSLILFIKDPHNSRPAVFSWQAWGILATFGMLMLVLAPLLWRDEHGVWAVVVCLPMLGALNGAVHGLKLRKAAAVISTKK